MIIEVRETTIGAPVKSVRDWFINKPPYKYVEIHPKII